MEIRTKFEVGQEVWGIENPLYVSEQECMDCEGAGELELKNGRSVRCPSCGGKGTRAHEERAGWRINNQGRILGIVIEINDPEAIDTQPNRMQYNIGWKRIEYGTFWEEVDLFPSQAEAEEACRVRNAKIAETAQA